MKKPFKKSKRIKGFSLILVASLGAIFVLMALALGSNMLPIYKFMGTRKALDNVDNALENGMQYAISQINTAASTGTVGSISTPIAVPSALTNGINVSVTMTPIPVGSLSTSPLINPDIQKYYSGNKACPAATDYRLLVATAPNYNSNLSVILGPSSAFIAQNSLWNKSNPQRPTAIPYFSGAAFADTSIRLIGSVSLLTEGATPLQAGLNSNGTISLGGANTIDGNLTAYAPPGTTSPNITGSPNVTINGNIDTGAASPSPLQFQTDGSVGSIPPNVLGNGALGPAFGSINFNDATLAATETPPLVIPSPTQNATVTSPDGSNFVVSAPPANAVVDIGSINLSGQQTLTLPPGQYVATSINLSGNAAINVSSSNSTTTGVSIFVQDSGPGNTISIMGNGINMSGTKAASNLQIFYGGSNNVVLGMNSNFQTFYGLIYAPNASVLLETGRNGQYHGAVSAKSLTMLGFGKMYFDPQSINPTGGSAGSISAGPAYSQWPANAQNPTKYAVLSWQEK